MSSQEVPLEAKHFPLLWVGAFAVTAVFGYGLTPWQTISQLVDSNGTLGDTQQRMVAFAAGYTLPATVAFAVVAFALQRGWFKEHAWQVNLLAVIAVFAAASFVSSGVASALLENAGRVHTGPILAQLAAIVFGTYLNYYGTGLLLTAAAIGTVSGLQADHWTRPSST